MEKASKTELAQAFLEELSGMPAARLQQIIQQAVGEELAALMFNYARQVMEAAPDKVVENASSLLVLGYLLRVHEQGQLPPDLPPA
ncbi:MAG: hypothetical protein D6806_08130 [Deltaproteobacteria bacterium]|nr:MAG: hypothetical protein D6806_08130 [Deltaproteobacteria bacterium]